MNIMSTRKTFNYSVKGKDKAIKHRVNGLQTTLKPSVNLLTEDERSRHKALCRKFGLTPTFARV